MLPDHEPAWRGAHLPMTNSAGSVSRRPIGKTVPVADPFLEGYVPYLLQRADQLLSEQFHAVLRDRDIQASEWRVLAVLLEDGPSPIRDLADRTMMPQPTTSHAVARLERAGLLERRSNQDDGRVRVVALSRRGRTEARQLVALANRCLERTTAAAGLTIDGSLLAELRSMIAALSGESPPKP